MVEVNKPLIVGVLTILLVISGALYITFNDNARLRVDEDKTTFYIKLTDSEGEVYGRWLVAGREYNRLFDGNSIMYRDKKGINIETHVDKESNEVQIIRTTPYQRGPIITDIYTFDGDLDDIRLFPISHEVIISNASGYYYRYSIDDLKETGDKRKLDGETYLTFGLKMKLKLHPGYRWAWIGWPYGEDSITAQYDIPSDYEEFQFRFFDPPIEGDNLIVESGTVTLGGNVSEYDSVWIKSGATLQINTTDKYLNLTANNITIDGTVTGISMYAGGNAGPCSSGDARSGYSGTASYTGGNGRGGPASDSTWGTRALGGGGGGNAVAGSNGGGYNGAWDVYYPGGVGGSASSATETNLIFTAGSGGGEGGCKDSDTPNPDGGSGGTGAGMLILNAPTVSVHGTVNLYGTNGAAGVGSYGGGGGGGSGGTLGIFANAVDLSSSTIKVYGGSGGARGVTTSLCTSGGSGAGGRIKIFYSTLDTTSMTTTLGTGLYTTVEIPGPNSSLVSENTNFTVANISGYCGGEVNFASSNMTFYWDLYKNGVLNTSGKTGNYTSATTVNVVNISSTENSHNDTWILDCIGSDYTYNLTAAHTLIVHDPIWFDINFPTQDEELGTTYLNVSYAFENYTTVDDCWYTNDSGVTNTSMNCTGTLGPFNWLEGQNNITLYGNTTGTLVNYTGEDYIAFFVVLTAPSNRFDEDTPTEGEWINVDTITAGCDITPCRNFDNVTIELNGESFT